MGLGFVDIPAGDEKKMMQAVATLGPVSVAIDASLDSFAYYASGIYNVKHCKKDDTNHAVLVTTFPNLAKLKNIK